jgi:hypothetical protein
MNPAATLISGTPTILIYIIVFGSRFANVDSKPIECMVLLFIIMCFLFGVYVRLEYEKEERGAFIINLRLVRNNDKLRTQLSHLEKDYKDKISNLDSPLEKAIVTLKSILANPLLDMSIHAQIDTTIEWLSASDKLFTPTFDIKEDGSEGENKKFNLEQEVSDSTQL